MRIDIIITIEVDEDNYNRDELKSNLLEGVPERTGYNIESIEINEIKD